MVAFAGLGASSGSAAAGYGKTSSSSGRVVKAASAARIAVRSTSLGRILVNGQGRSVYLFEKDNRKASTCYGACARTWPPVTTSRAPIAGKGVTVAMLGTRSRRNGTLQVTYNGHPLYTYGGDAKAGQTKGQGSNAFGGAWYVLSPAGKKIDND
jgi:predicted lipoprotein with Yx(FWY)xxD motif